MKRKLSLLMSGLTIAAMGMQMVPVKAEETGLANALLNFGVGTARQTAQAGAIFGASVGAAVAYGVINDSVTARVCPEYFTEGFHRNMLEFNNSISDAEKRELLNPENVNKIACWWGVRATWWMGARLSVPVIAAARLGSWPQLGVQDLAKPLAVGLGGLLGAGAIAGVVGYKHAKDNPDYARTIVTMSEASAINEDISKCRGYVTDTYAHSMGYAGGAVLGLGITGYALWKRSTL